MGVPRNPARPSQPPDPPGPARAWRPPATNGAGSRCAARPRPRPAPPSGQHQPGQPGSTATAGSAALCAQPDAVTRLWSAGSAPCRRTTCTSPSQPDHGCPARTGPCGSEAVCGLPTMPRVVMNCPADLGVSYRLSFGAGSASLPVVTASAGGCAGVAGAGPIRSARPLARVLGRPGPRHGHQHRRGATGTSPATRGTGPIIPGGPAK